MRFFSFNGNAKNARDRDSRVEKDWSREGIYQIASALHHAKYYSVSSTGKEKVCYTM